MRVLSISKLKHAAKLRAEARRKALLRQKPGRESERVHPEVRCPACHHELRSPLRREAYCWRCDVDWQLTVDRTGITYTRKPGTVHKPKPAPEYVTSDHGSKAKVHVDALKSLFDDD